MKPLKQASGVSLVELMIVVVIATMLLLPSVMFLISSQKTASKGLDRLNSLGTARIVLEKVQRDLRSFCYDATHGLRFDTMASKPAFEFPIFPSQAFSSRTSGAKTLINLVTYRFDPEKKALTRTEKIHPALRKPGEPSSVTENLGTNITAFSIKDRPFLGLFFFEIEVVCQSSGALRKETAHLRTGIRSEYETRLVRNKYQVPNRLSVLNFPP